MITPYELRFKIYQEAKDRLTEEYYSELARWGETKKHSRPIMPDFPTHGKIEKEALEIYEFVKRQD